MQLQQKLGPRNSILLNFDTKWWNHGIKNLCKIIIYKTNRVCIVRFIFMIILTKIHVALWVCLSCISYTYIYLYLYLYLYTFPTSCVWPVQSILTCTRCPTSCVCPALVDTPSPSPSLRPPPWLCPVPHSRTTLYCNGWPFLPLGEGDGTL